MLSAGAQAYSGGLEAVPLFRGAGSPSNTMSPGPRHTSLPSDILILDPSSRSATTDMGRKVGGCCAPFSGRWS